jgi:hypothetical protein
MDWEVVEDRQHPGQWRVEATNHEGDGEVYVTIFSGPAAQKRAQEYAEWQQEMVRAA